MLVVNPWAIGHKHFSAFAKRDPPNPESSVVSRREIGQLEKTNSSRQGALTAASMELKEHLWPEAAPNTDAKEAASGRVEMLPNQNKKSGAGRSSVVKSGAPRAGDSTSQMAKGPPKRGSKPSSANQFDYVQKLPSNLDGWLSFVKRLPRTRPLHEGLIMRRLQALTIIDNVSERAEDLSAAFLFLVDVARQQFTKKHATGLTFIAIALSKHKSLEKAMLYPGSPLLESIRGLMQAAASNALSYTDSQGCIRIATAQKALQLPCTEFLKTLSEREMPAFSKTVVFDLVLARMDLS